jgi:hypothetical protein
MRTPGELVRVELIGSDRVQQMFTAAPRVFSRTLTHFLWRERKNFVGNKRHSGSFRRTLERKKRKYREGTWSKAMGKGFTGSIDHPEGTGNMTLKMGISPKWQDRVPYLSELSRGYTVTPKNRQWLIIPMYRNLLSVGLFGRIGGTGMGKTKRTWSKFMAAMSSAGKLDQPFMYHGKLLFFGDVPDKGGSHEKRRLHGLHRKLLFVGVKRATVKQQFDFYKAFERRVPGVKNRIEKLIARTTMNLEKGKMWAE